jgi:predicted  nucleic acid-binding Zn-ribbon protein
MKTAARSFIILVCLLAAIAAGGNRVKTSAEPESVAAQDVAGLDRRISLLEQRFYSLESSISQLRQQITMSRPSSSASGVSDPRVDRLQSELQLLQQRIRELECAAVKLDERTLTQAAREARGAQRQATDPCRAQSATPVQLSSRPR